jgi:nucleotide-binding universal stress UspA family protein
MFKKILAALDKSDFGKSVFEEAVVLAKALDAKLILLHVLSPLEEGYPMPMYPGPDSVYPTLHEEAIRIYTQQWEKYEREGMDLLREFSDKATTTGVSVEFTQNVGDPGGVICDVARTSNADMIVMGRRGRSGLRELFLGSVSNYVLHHAPCSVLALQGQEVAESSTPTDPPVEVHS